MKTNTLLLASAAGLLCTAAVLLSDPAAPAAPAPVESRHRAESAPRNPAPAAAEARHAERLSDAADPDEAANLAVWQDRLAALEAEHGDRDLALQTLLGEIDSTYRTWVAAELGPVTGLPPAERYDELSDIERSVVAGTAAILEQLGIEESRHLAVVAGPAEAIVAETQYAEAANDSATRLALLKLDREREARLEQALALADETARTQAVAELDAWYDAGLGGIFTPAEP
jgi:hypothetical protein